MVKVAWNKCNIYPVANACHHMMIFNTSIYTIYNPALIWIILHSNHDALATSNSFKRETSVNSVCSLWQSRQPLRSHVRKSLLINMHITWILHSTSRRNIHVGLHLFWHNLRKKITRVIAITIDSLTYSAVMNKTAYFRVEHGRAMHLCYGHFRETSRVITTTK